MCEYAIRKTTTRYMCKEKICPYNIGIHYGRGMVCNISDFDCLDDYLEDLE